MYLSELNCWNFRKYGPSSLENSPSITANFTAGLNLLVGENDSGKTSIIDAIKLVLGTQSYDNVRVDINDFHKPIGKERETTLKIECVFKNLTPTEVGWFLEWLSTDEDNNLELKVRIIANLREHKVSVRKSAGLDGADISFDASELLRVTYLKPLRDAENELSPGYKSRFAQVLKSHPIFQLDAQTHKLVEYLTKANEEVEKYFQEDSIDGKEAGGRLIKDINFTLNEFLGQNDNDYAAKVSITSIELSKVLNKLMLNMDENKVGLGSLNQLYIAMELLLLKIKSTNEEFGLALIEEIEAHLHPQAQQRIIRYFQSNCDHQIILTTHSITLASLIDLKSLIICKNGQAYNMGSGFTHLSEGDYDFLERFLDATKSNLFFAKGVMFVEGDAENLLLPTIAQIIDLPLYKYGVSVVNVGNIAFLRYSNIFIRADKASTVGIPIAILTDLDVRPPAYYDATEKPEENKEEAYKFYSFKGIEGLEEIYLPSENVAKEILREHLQIDRLPNGSANNYITRSSDYETKCRIALVNKEDKYNFNEIKVFTNSWTLEYDIALSGLKPYILAAINIAKDIYSNENNISSINLNTYISDSLIQIGEWQGCGFDNTQIAYEIYRPLLENKASKAVTAQYLSKILLSKCQEDEAIKESILGDLHLKYIVDAIHHVINNGGTTSDF